MQAYQNTCRFIKQAIMDKPDLALEIYSLERVLDERIHLLLETEIHSSGYVIHTLKATLWCFLKETEYASTVQLPFKERFFNAHKCYE
ncbi:MAG: hypothetical protein HC880_19355 [Bacteroidia bacterium]|nr:hypothetical protein [Bacteroidia bacterium]